VLLVCTLDLVRWPVQNVRLGRLTQTVTQAHRVRSATRASMLLRGPPAAISAIGTLWTTTRIRLHRVWTARAGTFLRQAPRLALVALWARSTTLRWVRVRRVRWVSTKMRRLRPRALIVLLVSIRVLLVRAVAQHVHLGSTRR
jgi:hypothetical protein